MSEKKYNLKSPSVKRVLTEAKELSQPTDMYAARPLDDNIFEWHFTVRGPSDTAFDGGIYHGRILLPPEYPFKPPSIIVLTPNGRFEVGKKICLSISAYHPEYWRPSWSIRTVLMAMISFLPTDGKGSVASLDYPDEERARLAKKSTDWSCKTCGSHNADALLELNPEASHTPDAIDAEFIAQIAFKSEAEKKVDMEKQGKAAACSNDTKEAPTQTDTATQVNTQETLTRRSESADTPQAPPPASVGSASVAPVLTQRNTNAERIAQAQSEAPQPQPQTLSPRRPTYWGEIFLTILIWGVGIELLTMILIKFAV